jgi:NAD(P)-dependent dehydrogenase (short-subunit alcohol dehydrogenase family)
MFRNLIPVLAGQANRESLRDFVSKEATWFQYHEGASDPSLIAPETYTHDQHFLDRPSNIEIGRPQDIAEVAVFLASNNSAWITSQKLTVSGGTYGF